jgi:hypothetical protein
MGPNADLKKQKLLCNRLFFCIKDDKKLGWFRGLLQNSQTKNLFSRWEKTFSYVQWKETSKITNFRDMTPCCFVTAVLWIFFSATTHLWPQLWLVWILWVTESHCAWQRPPTTRPTTFHVGNTRGCQCSFRLLMMGGVSPERCWALYKYGIIKFWYIVAFCYIFLCELYYDAQIHGH